MSTYKQIFYHLIFSTKHREKTLTEKHQEELYKFIWGIVKEKHFTGSSHRAPYLYSFNRLAYFKALKDGLNKDW